MIITCGQCDKKFEIESTLIPEKGRLLQCSSCNHQWFYKKNVLKETEIVLKKQDIKSKKNEPPVENIKVFEDLAPSKEKFFEDLAPSKETIFEDLAPSKEKKRKHSYKPNQDKNKKISFLSIILVFIISIIALIVLLDTFKSSVNLMMPNIESVLDNLYETIRDILLFIQDLI